MPLKTCPGCQKQVGPRTKKCDCGHVFIAETAPVAASKDSMSLDPLDKRIAESVGAARDIISKVENRPSRTLSKSSGESTEKPTDTTPEATTPAVPPVRYFGGGRIHTPAGPCPVKPRGYKDGWPDGPASDEVVTEWAYAVHDAGGGKYTPNAVIYWARYYWDINGPEYKRIRDLIVRAFTPASSNHESEE